MSFHEVRFPTDISYGSRGGPGLNTLVTELKSGQENRIGRSSSAKRRYNAVYGIRDLDDLGNVYDFYICRDGVLNGFRYKDFMDFTTASNHRDAHSATDVVLGTGDGVQTVFQLKKIYSNGGYERTRIIEKPIHGETVDDVTYNVLVALAGTPTVSGWSVNTTNGEITFTSAPGAGVEVTAGCAFDTPARFGKEVDFNLSIQMPSFNAGLIPDIPIVELLDERQVDEEAYYGGSMDHGSINVTTSITQTQGRVHRFTPNSTTITVVLPDFADIPPGGPIFYLINNGTQNITVQDHTLATILTVTPNTSVVMLLTLDSVGAKEWVGA